MLPADKKCGAAWGGGSPDPVNPGQNSRPLKYMMSAAGRQKMWGGVGRRESRPRQSGAKSSPAHIQGSTPQNLNASVSLIHLFCNSWNLPEVFRTQRELSEFSSVQYIRELLCQCFFDLS